MTGPFCNQCKTTQTQRFRVLQSNPLIRSIDVVVVVVVVVVLVVVVIDIIFVIAIIVVVVIVDIDQSYLPDS